MQPGKIILFNGASSAGKSTLARALCERLEEPFYRLSFDHFRDAGSLPLDRIRSGELNWEAMRPAFFDGFHRSLAAFAGAGNNLLVEHIVETPQWMDDLVALLGPFDVFFVGVHCPLPELERRERARGDRRLGEARRDLGTAHAHAIYDLEVESTEPVSTVVDAVVSAWRARTRPSAFDRMGAAAG